MNLSSLLALFSGYRTYAGAAGLAVAAYLHFRAGDVAGAVALASAALTAFGLRAKLEALLGVKLPEVAVTPPAPPAPQ